MFKGLNSHAGKNNHFFKDFYWAKSALSEYGILNDNWKGVGMGKFLIQIDHWIVLEM